MRSIEESLQILDKMPAFQKKFEIFKQGIISAAQAGLTYRGNPVQVNYPSLKGEACRVTSFKSLVDQTECY